MDTSVLSSAARYVSKTTFLYGLQCPKLLWSTYHAKHLLPAVDDATQSVFDQAKIIGNLAKQLFPDGIEIATEPGNFDLAIQLTQNALPLGRPIYEASFTASGGYARADILNPVGADEWDVIEVKSTTCVKDVHLPDLAFQVWVYAAAGLKIRRCCVCYVNNEYVSDRPFDAERFFVRQDVTAQVMEILGSIAEQVHTMAGVIASTECPTVAIGKQCNSPYECPLKQTCWAFLPPRNVLELYCDTKGRGFELLNRGILRLADIPADYPISDRQAIQRKVAISGQPHVSRIKLQRFLAELKYPLHFLDFETFQSAVPIFFGTRPYEQIPFQFSLHLVRTPNAEPEHRKFLADERIDPRLDFLRSLQGAIEPNGSIVVYNAAFEKGRLKECAEVFPQFSGWAEGVISRMVDLMIPFRGFQFYHPDQCGSASIKDVLPALTGKDYKGLEIQKGDTASREFFRITFTEVDTTERERVRQALERYCGQDTEAMIWVLEVLTQTVRKM